MIYYLLLAYYIQSFRAYHFYNKTDDYLMLNSMYEFTECMVRFIGYEPLYEIWSDTSYQSR